MYLILLIFSHQTNKGINLADVYSLWSKLANIKIQGVFWPVIESLGGVWVFFPKIYVFFFFNVNLDPSFDIGKILFMTYFFLGLKTQPTKKAQNLHINIIGPLEPQEAPQTKKPIHQDWEENSDFIGWIKLNNYIWSSAYVCE